jgi:hypothetical protein
LPAALICGGCPLKQRKVALARVCKGAEAGIALTNGVVGEGRAFYRPWSMLTHHAHPTANRICQ